MSRDPYPGWPPNYTAVNYVNNKHRTCLVVDIRSDNVLSTTQLAILSERIEATILRGELTAGIEAFVITSDRFDRVVSDGLRLSQFDRDGRVSGPVELPDEDPFE